MNLLDVRTVVFSFVTIHTICLFVMACLWFQNKEHFVARSLSQAHNYLLPAAFLSIQSCFAFAHSVAPRPYFGGPGT